MKRKEVGKVYAIHTSKGEAIVQVCAEERELEPSTNITQIRVFSRLYPSIPENIQEIVNGKEDFRIYCVVRTMTSKKYNMATYLGLFELPSDFEMTKYFKYGRGESGIEWWTIDKTIDGDNEYQFGIPVYDWVVNDLKMNPQKEDWKEIFSELDQTYICNGLRLIERLENNWNPRRELPSDFNEPGRVLMQKRKPERYRNN